MPESIYHQTEVIIDDIHYKAGDVVRLFDDTAAFNHAVILGFSDTGHALLSRPYAYASNVGTTGPTVLLGAERISMYPITSLKKYCMRVGKDRVAR